MYYVYHFLKNREKYHIFLYILDGSINFRDRNQLVHEKNGNVYSNMTLKIYKCFHLRKYEFYCGVARVNILKICLKYVL